MFEQHIIIEGRHMGTATRVFEQVREQRAPPLSLAWSCGICGRQWAIAPIKNGVAWAGGIRWRHLVATCGKCADTYSTDPVGSIAGSLEWNTPELLELLPDAALLREVELHLQHYEVTHG